MNPVDPPVSRLSIALNLFGVAVVTYYVVHDYGSVLAPWMLATALLGLAAWLVEILAPVASSPTRWRGSPWRVADLAVMCAIGALIAAPTLGLGIVLMALAVVRLVGTLEIALGVGVLVAAASGVIVSLVVALSIALPGVAAVLVPGLEAPDGVAGRVTADGLVAALLATLGGLVIATLVGVSRRQFRAAEAQARALLDERQAVRDEQARVQRLGERQGLARDIHDVLAHSLGGLVLQLDAVDALLDAGRVDEAATRVRSARQLAASGLSEARRAVDALRDPEAAAPVALAELRASIAQLADAHRALGGTVHLHDSPATASVATPRASAAAPLAPAAPIASDAVVAGDAAEALRRAVQEGLTNARKHSPGAAVTITLGVAADGVEVEIANALPPRPRPEAAARANRLTASGGGNGLVGMRERFAALPGADVTAGPERTEFVVRARVGLAGGGGE